MYTKYTQKQEIFFPMHLNSFVHSEPSKQGTKTKNNPENQIKRDTWIVQGLFCLNDCIATPPPTSSTLLPPSGADPLRPREREQMGAFFFFWEA